MLNMNNARIISNFSWRKDRMSAAAAVQQAPTQAPGPNVQNNAGSGWGWIKPSLVRGATIATIFGLFTTYMSYLPTHPFLAVGGIAIACAALYLGRDKIQEMTWQIGQEFWHLNRMTKVIIVVAPILLGITAPLMAIHFLKLSIDLEASHLAIAYLAVFVSLLPFLRSHDEKIDMFFCQGSRTFIKTDKIREDSELLLEGLAIGLSHQINPSVKMQPAFYAGAGVTVQEPV
jgi:hypothetical protein